MLVVLDIIEGAGLCRTAKLGEVEAFILGCLHANGNTTNKGTTVLSHIGQCQ